MIHTETRTLYEHLFTGFLQILGITEGEREAWSLSFVNHSFHLQDREEKAPIIPLAD